MKSLIWCAIALFVLMEHAVAQSWQRVEGVNEGVTSVAVNPRNKNTIWFGGFRKIYVSYDAGRTVGRIIELSLPMVSSITTVFIHPKDTAFVMAAGIGCFMSRDNGVTWAHALPDTEVVFDGESIASEPHRPDTIYVGPLLNNQNPLHDFFRSTDGGRFWVPINIPAFGDRSGFCSITAAGNGVLFGGTTQRGVISRSTNMGSTWTEVFAASDTAAEIPKITIDKQVSRIVWATVLSFSNNDGRVLKSRDFGTTWESYQLPGTPWAIETDAQGRVYVGMFGRGEPGAYVSTNGGLTWVNNRAGLPTDAKTGLVWMIKSNGDPFGIFLADGDMGAFRFTSEVVRVEEPQLPPYTFALAQNHPNPFNPVTTIAFTLSTPSKATLKIYDLQGREVAVLLDEAPTSAGVHGIRFDGRALSSGIYLYQLEAGGKSETKKMLLTK